MLNAKGQAEIARLQYSGIMAILFRIDVDKPFGHHNVMVRVASKLSEEFNVELSSLLPYLRHNKALTRFLTSRQVPAFFYFRNCTKPDAETLSLLKEGHHLYGFHAENTRNADTFWKEFSLFCTDGVSTKHFTKHGSGYLKLGKLHYPPYEPERYQAWCQQNGLRYFSGNRLATSAEELCQRDEYGFWPAAFWVEEQYRDPAFNQLEDFLTAATRQDVILLTHSSNFYTHQKVKDDIAYIVEQVKIRKRVEKGKEW